MDVNERIIDAAPEHGLTATPCGENADWIDPVWHLGPSLFPNREEGDYYIMEQCERGEIGYALVQHQGWMLLFIEAGWENPEPLLEMAAELINKGV